MQKRPSLGKKKSAFQAANNTEKLLEKYLAGILFVFFLVALIRQFTVESLGAGYSGCMLDDYSPLYYALLFGALLILNIFAIYSLRHVQDQFNIRDELITVSFLSIFFCLFVYPS